MKRTPQLFRSSTRGFALPFIMLVSTGLMFIGLSMVQSTSSIRESLSDQYLNRMATTAAEAGISYANYCMSANNLDQTWGPATGNPNLAQNTNCSGADLPSAPNFLLSNGLFRTIFTVSDLEVRSDGAIIVSSTGTAQQVRASSGSVARQYTVNRKQVVNWQALKPSVSASGSFRTCAIISRELWCWGQNNFGQLGNSSTTDSLVPVKVTQSAGILAGVLVDSLFAAHYHNCALANKKVYCWGANDQGQLGDGTTTNRTAPVLVQGSLAGKDVIAIGGAGNSSCAIALESGKGKIYCWGQNDKGTVGRGDTSGGVTSPTAVATPGTSTTLASTYNATMLSTSGSRSQNMCAVADGDAWCWGNNEIGQIGDGTSGTAPKTSPTKVRKDSGVLAGKTIVAISQDGYECGFTNGTCTTSTGESAYNHVCVVAQPTSGNNAIYCWGENDVGQLGNGTTTKSNIPVAVRANTGDALFNKSIQGVALGLRHSCAVAAGKAFCWGLNGNGQVGVGTSTASYSLPQAVIEQSGGLQGQTVTAIGGGSNRGCALTSYKAWCWGVNTNGQIGDGTTTNRLVPTESIYLRPKSPAFVF